MPAFILALIIVLIHVSDCYYISGNLFSINEAYKFCINICQSQLSSIHNTAEMQEAIHTILNRPSAVWGNTYSEANIGLISKDYPTDPYKWNDSTPFNYGNDTTSGLFPWNNNPLQNKSCVTLQTWSTSYGWNNAECINKRRFLCNDCNGKLNKYALIATNITTKSAANSLCATNYNGSTLASIHTARDNNEAKLLYDIFSVNLWMGLNIAAHSNTNTYSWDDGTPFNYGSNINGDPWSGTGHDNNGLNEYCVQMGPNQKWIDVACNHTNDDVTDYILCNLPSELALGLSHWEILKGSNYITFTTSNGIDIAQQPPNSFVDIVIPDKQWYNGDEPLLIDYTFSVDLIGKEMFSGLTIFNAINSSLCNYYYIGFESTDNYYLILSYQDQQTRSYLQTVNINNIYNVNQYYLLLIKITNGNMFEVSIDDILYISYDHTSNTNALNNGYSGHIGIVVEDYYIGAGATKAKSLYVSGTPIYGYNILETSENCIPTANPTTPPPTNPTNTPTLPPVVHTSAISIKPTKHPTTEHIVNASLPTDNLNGKLSTSNPNPETSESIIINATMFSVLFVTTTEFIVPEFNSSTSDILKYILLFMFFLCVFFMVTCYMVLKRVKTKVKDSTEITKNKSSASSSQKHIVAAKNASILNESSSDDDIIHRGSTLKMETDDFDDKTLIAAWLKHTVELPQYYQLFVQNGYESMRFIKRIQHKSELQEIGINMLGHQTMIMSEIRKLQHPCNYGSELVVNADDLIDNNRNIGYGPFNVNRHSQKYLNDKKMHKSTMGNDNDIDQLLNGNKKNNVNIMNYPNNAHLIHGNHVKHYKRNKGEASMTIPIGNPQFSLIYSTASHNSMYINNAEVYNEGDLTTTNGASNENIGNSTTRGIWAI